MHKSLFFPIFVGIAVFHQISAAAPPDLEWSVSAGMNRYIEPEMQLMGPELGLHAKTRRLGKQAGVLGEADVFMGQQHYSSDTTGSMDRVTNIESRWRGLTRVMPGIGPTEGLYAGLGLHTLWNDLRGNSTTSNAGYERQAVQLWFPLRWVSNNRWELETGVLLRGRHTSKLSQANPNDQDVTNTQKRGTYAQASWDYSLDARNQITPYVRYTHLADSDVVIMGGESWVEPNSQRWQLGLKWRWDTR
jgi:hypothetical protein